jgi:hypothetical protein
MAINWENVLLALIAVIPPTVAAAAAFWKAGQTHDLVDKMRKHLNDPSSDPK